MEGYLASILSAIPQNEPITIEVNPSGVPAVLPRTAISNSELKTTQNTNPENQIITWFDINWLPAIIIIIIGGVLGYLIATKK